MEMSLCLFATEETVSAMSRIVLTYGTFDLFHVGHLRLLQRARALGDHLIVGVSTDEFNQIKGKKAVIDFRSRAEIIGAIGSVDEVIAENCWEQKRADIERYHASILTMGNDWTGRFDFLKAQCQVIYMPRTEGLSSSSLRATLATRDVLLLENLQRSFESASAALQAFQAGRILGDVSAGAHRGIPGQDDVTVQNLISGPVPELNYTAARIGIAA